ncbi:MAG: hypothetical protein NZ933_07635 [Bacteroidia bacterium]|nr:hypothetical protein [Bacteroidia bacterium]
MRRRVLGLLLLLPLVGWSQCAMCRKNAEAASSGLARGLRVGIIVLFAAPYIAVGLIGWLWYKQMHRSEGMGHSNRDSESELPSRAP